MLSVSARSGRPWGAGSKRGALGPRVIVPDTPHVGWWLRTFALSILLALGCSDSAGPDTSADAVASVSVSPAGGQLLVGDTLRLTAVAKNAAGITLPGKVVVWSSDSSHIASVTDQGMITANALGLAKITADVTGTTAHVSIHVVAPVAVAYVALSPDEGDLSVGDTLRLTATTYDIGGDVLTGRPVAWASDKVDVASVDTTGLVTAHGEGTAFITATSGTESATSEIRVSVPAPVTPVLTSLSPATIQAGWGNFTLVVNGTGFVPQSRVLWEGVPLTTYFVDATKLEATVSASYVALEGTAQVSVETPLPAQLTSNELTFTIFSRPAFTVDLMIPGNTVLVGGAVRLAAVARDQFGVVIDGKEIVWTSSDTTVAKVDGDLLRGLKPGMVNLVASATPTFSGTTFFVIDSPVEEILFGGEPTGTPELFARALDPAGPVRRFLPPVTYARQAAPSPSGDLVAFVGRDAVGDEDIYVADRNGGNVVRLTTAAGIDDQPAWSPDGSTIAFRSFRQGKSDIWLMDADGSNQRNLTYAGVFIPEEFNDRPAWSPDSQTLVFSRGFGLGQSLYTIGADGTGLDEFLFQAGVDLLEPTWSADGQYIAFRRRDRVLDASVIDVASSATGGAVFFINGAPIGSRQPKWLADGWLAVSAPVLPGSTVRTVALVRMGFGNVVVPMGEEYGLLEEPVALPN